MSEEFVVSIFVCFLFVGFVVVISRYVSKSRFGVCVLVKGWWVRYFSYFCYGCGRLVFRFCCYCRGCRCWEREKVYERFRFSFLSGFFFFLVKYSFGFDSGIFVGGFGVVRDRR